MRVTGDAKFPARAAVIAHRAMNGESSIVLQIVAFGRGRLHEHEEVTSPNDGRHGMDARRAILADRCQISDSAIQPFASKRRQFRLLLFENFPGHSDILGSVIPAVVSGNPVNGQPDSPIVLLDAR